MIEVQPCLEAGGEMREPLSAPSQPLEPLPVKKEKKRKNPWLINAELHPSGHWDTGVAGLSFGTFAWRIPNTLCSKVWTEQMG